MKKLLVVLLVLLIASPVFGAVGYKKDNTEKGVATTIDFERGFTTFDGSTLTFYANGYAGGVTTNVSAESNLTSAALAYGIIYMSGGNKTITLYNGTSGQMITLVAGTIAATITIAPASYPQLTCTKTGWTTIALTATNQSITLLYVDDTTGWIIVGNAGTTIT